MNGVNLKTHVEAKLNNTEATGTYEINQDVNKQGHRNANLTHREADKLRKSII